MAKLEAEEARRKTVTETISTPPTPRSNFSLCAHPDKEELILFGGEFFNGNEVTIYNELFFYNIAKDEWKSVRSPAGPAPRSSHQMVAVANDGGQLWIFGGEHPSPSQMQFFHYRDLWVYRLAEKKWEKVSATGGPSARSGHRMVAIKKKLFVFGGFYDSGISYTYFNDVWMFSMETYTWHEIKCEGVIKPAPRSAGCMAATPDGKLLVWGGYSRTSVKKDIDRGVTHSDMFVLTPESESHIILYFFSRFTIIFLCTEKDESGLVWKWSTVKPGGFKPMPRSGVGLTTTANGIGYTFGGVVDVDEDEENVLGNFSNDMYSIDLAKPTWRYIELNPKGTKSKGAAAGKDQEMTDAQPVEKMSDNAVFKMVVGGGPSSFTGVFGQAPKPKVLPGNVPSPRMNASLVVCKKHLYLYGGIVEDGNKQFTLADLYSLGKSLRNQSNYEKVTKYLFSRFAQT